MNKIPYKRYLISSDDTTKNVVILSGQSNINGFNNAIANIPANIQGTYSGIKVYKTDNTLVDLDSSVNSSFQIPNTNGSFAVQYPLMVDIYNALGSTLHVIQYAIGATSLATNWLPSTGQYYLNLRNWIGNVKNGFPGTVNFKFFVWVQGEQDANTLADANAYETNLTNFISAIRTLTGTTIPFVIVHLNTNSTLTYKNTIRTAQSNVCANVASCYLVNVDSCEMQADNVHYTAQGYIDMSTAIMAVVTANNLI